MSGAGGDGAAVGNNSGDFEIHFSRFRAFLDLNINKVSDAVQVLAISDDVAEFPSIYWQFRTKSPACWESNTKCNETFSLLPILREYCILLFGLSTHAAIFAILHFSYDSRL